MTMTMNERETMLVGCLSLCRLLLLALDVTKNEFSFRLINGGLACKMYCSAYTSILKLGGGLLTRFTLLALLLNVFKKKQILL